MIKTFKETLTSLQDNHYGSQIIDKPIKSVIWYWTRYLLLVAVFPLFLAIVLLTRFTPELPKFARDLLPEGTIGARDNQLVTTIAQPLKLGDKNFGFVLNLDGALSDLDDYEAGVLILKDRIVTKTPDGSVNTDEIGNLPDFTTDRDQLASWLADNRTNLWLGGFLTIFFAAIAVTAITWATRMGIFAIWALVFWLAAKYLLKKNLNFYQGFKLVVYASILPLLISAVTLFAPNVFLDFIGTTVFLFYGISWLWNLPTQTPPSLVVPEVIIEPVSPKQIHSKRKKK